MPEMLEWTFDKFTFRVAADRFYSPDGIWAKPEEPGLRIGLSDFLQQRSGDVAFVEVKPVGTLLKANDEAAVIETIKVDLSLAAPVAGKIVEINPALESTPEVINQDPYEAGWLMVIEPKDWENSRQNLLDPLAYLSGIKAEAEQASR